VNVNPPILLSNITNAPVTGTPKYSAETAVLSRGNPTPDLIRSAGIIKPIPITNKSYFFMNIIIDGGPRLFHAFSFHPPSLIMIPS
jgi:hypothetical protein